MIKRSIWRLILFQVLSVTMTACFLITDKIEIQDIVGVWVENREDCNQDSSNCARFEFMEDGRFKAINIPDDYFGYFPFHSNKYFDASGEWKIELSSDPLGAHIIYLYFDPVHEMDYPEYVGILYAEGKKGDFELFAWHGDPVNRIEFLKLSIENKNTQP